MKAIAIIGFMAVGKTSVAKLLASKLDCEFIDTDEEIEEEQDMSIAEIFQTFGEEYFRQLEHEMIVRSSQMENVVLATGGGAVISAKNRALLKENCFLVTLTSTPEVILKRVENDGATRPILSEDTEKPYDRICRLQKEREAFYQNADLTIDTSEMSIYEIVTYIIEQMSRLGVMR